MTVALPGRAADARLALLVLDAEDTYSKYGPQVQIPAVGARVAVDYFVRGYLTGTDALFRPFGALALGAQRVFYGVLLESMAAPGTFVLVVRGTSGIVEWLEDSEFVPVPGKRPGCVEAGFFGIASTLTYRDLDGRESATCLSIPAVVKSGSVTVVGHSLGAALATYLAYDLAAQLPGKVALRVFASPHPGDETFVNAVARSIPDHIHYANTADLVPKVPVGLGYARLPNTVELAPATDKVLIKMSLGCLHHALSYAALLDPTVLDEYVSQADQPYLKCITRRGAAAA
jgi:triacylglycerol lipase